MLTNSIWQFATAGAIKFGRGCRHQLPDLLTKYRLDRPLIVTDHNLAELSMVREVLEALASATRQVNLFDACRAEPSVSIAEAAAACGRDYDVDCVIGIGGGSNLDVAKVAATVIRHGGPPSNYFGFDAIPGPVLPIFALPTTAGTGSEVSHSAVLTDETQRIKVSTLSHWLRPTCAVVDPALTDSCPPAVTAHSGIDALVHAVEAFTNRDFAQLVDVDPQARAYEGSYPLTRLLAAEAIRLVGKYLVAAYERPDDQVARDRMAMAAMLAGMAFSNSGVSIVHALEYPIGVLTHCSHGEGNGLLLPHAMRYNLPECRQQLAQIAVWLGAESRQASSAEAGLLAIETVERLQVAVGIRRRLRDLGLQPDTIPLIAQQAFGIRRLMDLNPRTPSEADLQAILTAAY